MRPAPLLLALQLGCDRPADPLPAEIVAAAPEAPPSVVQVLYDTPPDATDPAIEQRVRLLVLLRHLELSGSQLDLLERMRADSASRRAGIVAAEQAERARREAETTVLYEQLWEGLAAGRPLDAPEMIDLADHLAAVRGTGDGGAALQAVRIEGIQAVLAAEQEFLASLSPQQEERLALAVFALRTRLDPVGSPGDFQALVGTTWEPGQTAVLSRGTADATRPLDIGGLWSDHPGLEGPVLHEARREVILYMLLMEPGLGEAIAVARQPAGGADGPAPSTKRRVPAATLPGTGPDRREIPP